jgi:hypothetical protein
MKDSLVIVRPERFVVLRTAQTNRKRLMAPMFVVGLMHGHGQSFLAEGPGLDHTKSAFFDVANINDRWSKRKRGIACARGIVVPGGRIVRAGHASSWHELSRMDVACGTLSASGRIFEKSVSLPSHFFATLRPDLAQYPQVMNHVLKHH